MLDIKFVRENPELVKENIKKKFQDSKLLLVDEVIALDAEYRAAITARRLNFQFPPGLFQRFLDRLETRLHRASLTA